MYKGYYEFFAGVGLVRLALDAYGWNCLWANDLDPKKQHTYELNFGQDSHFLLEDVWKVSSKQLPLGAFLATASFPCVDLSLAGKRKGLDGEHSGTFHAFIKILQGLRAEGRKPLTVLLENVSGFLTAGDGKDIRDALLCLAELGYAFDLLLVDAVNFVPQSRPRVFVIAVDNSIADKVLVSKETDHLKWLFEVSSDPVVRPKAVMTVMAANPDLPWGAFSLPKLQSDSKHLDDVVERFPAGAGVWWPDDKKAKIYGQMSPKDKQKLEKMMAEDKLTYGTIYRRVRKTGSMAELRTDGVAGCLRTPKGGSSKQIVLQAGHGGFAVRWMTPREYARLQGVPDDYKLPENAVSALFGMGDAVCVPAVSWIVLHALNPCYEAYLAALPQDSVLAS